MEERRVLCNRCKQDYKSAGYKCVPDFSKSNKEECFICGRLGYEYVIKVKENGKRE